MADLFAFALFVTTIILWFVTLWYSRRVLHRFCARFPEVAIEEIPFAFDSWIGHPKKLTFFFTRRAKEIASEDQPLLRSRIRLISLWVASALLPLIGFTVLAAVALSQIYK